MLPRVVLHNAVSVDGRNSGFPTDIGLYYELARQFKEDATLAGSGTILASPEMKSDDGEPESPPPTECDPQDSRPLLVIPDSRGRVRCWDMLRQAGYWRDMIAICSRSTPKEHLDYLHRRRVRVINAGNDRVDLRAALDELAARHGVKVVRADSGGTLNGVLLRMGLADEISVLIHPTLAGGDVLRSIFKDNAAAENVRLRLIHMERLRDDLVWLRYEVCR